MAPARLAYRLGGAPLMEFLDSKLHLVELASAAGSSSAAAPAGLSGKELLQALRNNSSIGDIKDPVIAAAAAAERGRKAAAAAAKAAAAPQLKRGRKAAAAAAAAEAAAAEAPACTNNVAC
uniref:Uncharacterized protein n=1 Tax=Tetradesmus obliquus TaxID=3088 RepID=A0A383VM65_TETOB